VHITLRKIIGVLLVAVSIIAAVSTLNILPSHTTTTIITTTTEEANFEGNWGWVFGALLSTIMVGVFIGVILAIQEKPVKKPIEGSRTEPSQSL
jgi:phosphotransferase system  glucose/maltose/N-acetylglucosamine-specific IIC component